MTGVRLWNGDICDLQVDALVVPAMPTLFMTYGVAAAVKQRGGHGIEFEAASRGRQEVGTAVATGAGSLAARHVIHAVSAGPDRKTSTGAIDAATRSALRLADSLGAGVVAFAPLGSPLGGVPLAESARVMLRALHETLGATSVGEVVIALRSAATYAIFREELSRQRMLRAVQVTPGSELVGIPIAPADAASAADPEPVAVIASAPAPAGASPAPGIAGRPSPGADHPTPGPADGPGDPSADIVTATRAGR